MLRFDAAALEKVHGVFQIPMVKGRVELLSWKISSLISFPSLHRCDLKIELIGTGKIED